MTTEWDALPDTIKTFMTTLDARQDDRTLATFTADAVVIPGGVADLHFRFTLDGVLISRLVIEP